MKNHINNNDKKSYDFSVHSDETVYKQLVDDIGKIVELSREATRTYYYSYRSDKLAYFLIDKLNFKPVKSGIIGFIVTALFYIVAFLFHIIENRDIAGLGIYEVHLDLIYDFSIIPFVYYFYVWINLNPQELFTKLQIENINVLTKENKDYIKYYNNKIINNQNIYFIALVVSFSLVIFMEIESFTESNFMWGTKEANFWLFRIYKAPILWGIGYYMIIVIYLRQLLTIFGIHKLINDKLILKFSSDRSKTNSLKLVSKYCSKFTYLIGVCGVAYCLLISRSTYFNYFEIDIIINSSLIIYFIVSIYFFFYPLYPFFSIIYEKLKINKGLNLQPIISITYQPILSFIISLVAPIVLYNILK